MKLIQLFIATLLLIGFADPASAESWDEFDANYNANEAVHYMNKGYAEIGKVLNDLAEYKDNTALRHFNYATKDFDKAENALQKDDLATAQKHYDEAQAYFAQASILLD